MVAPPPERAFRSETGKMTSATAKVSDAKPNVEDSSAPPTGSQKAVDAAVLATRSWRSARLQRDVEKAMFKGTRKTPREAVIKLEKNERQQRFGIRLSSKDSTGAKDRKGCDGWLVPPSLMSSKLLSASKSSTTAPMRGSELQAKLDDTQKNSTAPEPSLPNAQRVRVSVSAKQSGVVGVWYHPSAGGAWVAKWNEGHKSKSKYFYFKDQKKAKTPAKAEAKALKEAIKFRMGKIQDKSIKVINQHGRRATRVSGVKGITWHATQKVWCVRIVVNHQTIRCGRCRPVNLSEDAVEEARKNAVEARRRAEEKYFDVRTSPERRVATA
mmetsp:Transcript_54150/g.116955  ORF Transcript_54150/g.116955 Transcript_54150/m.116955 type:complete len:326 (-) Transcript_54150:220-1197(-)